MKISKNLIMYNNLLCYLFILRGWLIIFKAINQNLLLDYDLGLKMEKVKKN
jgi:hypothetical protein